MTHYSCGALPYYCRISHIFFVVQYQACDVLYGRYVIALTLSNARSDCYDDRYTRCAFCELSDLLARAPFGSHPALIEEIAKWEEGISYSSISSSSRSYRMDRRNHSHEILAYQYRFGGTLRGN